MDVVASLYGRNSLLDIVSRTSAEIFIPLTVGGGLRTIDDIRAALRAGADKVSLNTAAIADPRLISEAARLFGSSTIVVSIEAIRLDGGSYEAYTENGRQATGKDAVEWARQAAKLGAGELLVTAIARDGSGSGFDLELVRRIAACCPVPVVAAGGAGSVNHVVQVVEAGADAVCIGSILHYEAIRHWPAEHDRAREGNFEYLRGAGTSTSPVRPSTILEIKMRLAEAGIACRPAKVSGG